jgi:predicted nucleic acid-binding protein
MTQPVIIDNSVVIRWFHPSGTREDVAQADKILGSLETGHITPVAPFILTMEFPNVLHTLARRGELKGNIESALMHFEHLSFEIIGTEFNAQLYIQALSQICSLYEISAYDAAYLELAIRMDYPLLTLDKRLKKAAKKAAIDVAPKLK